MFFILKYVVTSYHEPTVDCVCDVQGQYGRSIPCQDCVKLNFVEDLGALVDYFDFFLLTCLCVIFLSLFYPCGRIC